jgi:DNA-binding transcriptional LysR family regulator
LTYTFLNDALTQFRELFPLVEVTVLTMDNRAQVDALLNGSIMLGTIFRGPSFEDIRGEELTVKLLLQCGYCVVFSKHRALAKRGSLRLSDFRDDNFLTFTPGMADDHQHLVRTVCQLDGGFEPKLLPVGNGAESLTSMANAGRGVFLRPEVGFRERASGVNYLVLPESKNPFKLYVAGRKNFEQSVTVNNFVRILFEAARPLSSTRAR